MTERTTFFDTSLNTLKGLGPQRTELLNKELNLFTYGDLIQYYPFRYDDRTRYYLPSAAKNSPYFEPRRYWRGPVWLNVNWLLVEGLRRYGYADVAEAVTAHTLELAQRGGFAEYYDPRDGTPCGARDFSWSAALVLELLDR